MEFDKSCERRIMEQRMITIYCLIEEFLKGVIGKEEHVLFLGYVAVAVADCNGDEFSFQSRVLKIYKKNKSIRRGDRVTICLFR